ncbi:hypothetical protein L873DRAFT_1041108 [Choiromyces venosus 120613-1]|uniref:DDE-1 domain-containing protein n=1 Tax=Choiromyces venosus 120613-1 TaxID=1336337 RepID=A0A3N4JJI6_9PEZI|nr:hypothetical protein L873DRAFT_1041108 [Choiromyces venosus 120613-1]
MIYNCMSCETITNHARFCNIPFCFPTHSSHLLQPLDVGLFSPQQYYYVTELD